MQPPQKHTQAQPAPLPNKTQKWDLEAQQNCFVDKVQRSFGVFFRLDFMLMLTGYKRHFRWNIRITADIGSWQKKNTAFLIKKVFITCRVYIYQNRSTLNLTTLISSLKATFYNKNCNEAFYNKSRTSLTWIFITNMNIFTSNPYCFRPICVSERKIGLHDEVGKAQEQKNYQSV